MFYIFLHLLLYSRLIYFNPKEMRLPYKQRSVSKALDKESSYYGRAWYPCICDCVFAYIQMCLSRNICNSVTIYLKLTTFSSVTGCATHDITKVSFLWQKSMQQFFQSLFYLFTRQHTLLSCHRVPRVHTALRLSSVKWVSPVVDTAWGWVSERCTGIIIITIIINLNKRSSHLL